MNYEDEIREDLHRYLVAQNEVDEMLPDAPDIEMKWPVLAQSYMADGVREFGAYPTVSLGWMMYVGMAVAAMWDTDWEAASRCDDLYADLRDHRGFDALDEYVRQEVLGLKGEEYQQMERLVGECASRTYARLRRQNLEPGTPAAFHAYVASIHQMYLFGAAIWLHRLGYHMTKVDAR